MKKFFISLLFLGGVFFSVAQNNVGIGTSTPAASAALDISSTTKGLLIPRMTTAERTAIASPAKGLMVFDNTTSTYWFYNGSTWAEISGGSSNFSLPYSGSVASASAALNIANTGDGKAITASSTSSFTAAIEATGNGTGGYGVVGNSMSASGYGIYGLNATGTAVYGFSASGGVAIRGNSPTGYALLTNGNLRLTGGNTNPAEGAVLTSVDANGNAVWKPRKVGFCATGSVNVALSHNIYRKVEFNSEEYDEGNNFLNYAGTTTTESSVFTAPVNGVYHFSVVLQLYLTSNVTNFTGAYVKLVKNGLDVIASEGQPNNNTSTTWVPLNLDTDVKLNASDKIWVEVRQINSSSVQAGFYQFFPFNGRFISHLVFAD